MKQVLLCTSRWVARCFSTPPALAALALSSTLSFAAGKMGPAVFYLDDKSQPVVHMERVPRSEGVRAILALYALENGAGCGGKNEQGQVKCSLTNELGLGDNCSEEHISLVRAWFTKTPNLTPRWNEAWDGDAHKPGSLENLCYGQPDTASWQNIWEIIRVDASSDVVIVDAIFFGGSQHGRTRTRYVTTFRVGNQRITALRTSTKVLESSSKSIFEGK